MDDINSFLVDWSIRYLQNKDSINKEIVDIEKIKDSSDFIVHYKDRIRYFNISPILESCVIDKIKTCNNYSIFTLNNNANIRFVVNGWKELITFKDLKIHFINPFSSVDKVWAINPYTHARICDNSSLDLGLKSMSEMVVPIGLEELNQKIRMLK
jgi:hypothetical protein